MYCKNCGARLRDGAEFCDACGSHVQQNAQPPHWQPNYSEPTRPPRNNNGIIIAVIILVAVVAVAAIVCFTVLTRGKQQAQLAAIQQEQSSQMTTQQQVEQADDGAGTDDTASEKEEKSGTTIHNNYYYYDTHHRQDDYYDNVTSSGYLWPTDTEYISSSDLSGLGQDTVAAIRNEIYARHGYAFTTSRWQDYFSSKSWYVRDESCTESTVTARLNSVEKANVNTIVAYEESMGWR